MNLTTQQKFLQRNESVFVKYIDESKLVNSSVHYQYLVINNPNKLVEIITTNSIFSFKTWAEKYFAD